MNELIRRVETLERSNRLLRRWCGAALALSLIAVAAGQMGTGRAASVPTQIEAQAFVLKDAAGNIRAALSTAGNYSASLVLVGDGSTANFAMSKDSVPQMVLSQNDGPGVMVSADTESAMMTAHDGKTAAAASIGVVGKEPSFSLTDHAGKKTPYQR